MGGLGSINEDTSGYNNEVFLPNTEGENRDFLNLLN